MGYSGGKDSTALLQLVYTALLQLPKEKLSKPVYILASDTRVETPKILSRVQTELDAIQQAAERDGLPISTHVVYPKLNDTFWVNLIGRGYPSPTNHFRWCTDRLKIYPASAFIQEVVSKSGEVVITISISLNTTLHVRLGCPSFSHAYWNVQGFLKRSWVAM